MIAETEGLSKADLDALLDEAVTAEAAGQPAEALSALTIAVAELLARGKAYQYPFELMARLESALGAYDAAERSATVGRQIAEEAGHGPGVFRMDVLRADVARQALDLPRAEAVLSELRGDGKELGRPSTERLGEIVRWLSSLRFPSHPGQNLAVLRVETALTLAELWSEQGKYRSALRLVEAIEPELDGAGSAVRLPQVWLLQAELSIAAGDLAAADKALAAIPTQENDVDRARIAIVRTRGALLGGRLARVVTELDALSMAPPGDPALFAAATSARVAFESELNLLEVAQQTATEALVKLVEAGAPAGAIAVLERAKRAAAAREHSAMALWEFPFVVPRENTLSATPVGESPSGVRWHLTTAWTSAANRVLAALERGDIPEAAAAQAELEEIARDVESDYVACRVELSASIVDHYRGTATASRFLAIAERLHTIGARPAEAQAVRFAAWTAARARQLDEYGALVRQASAIIDEIANELDPERRAQFMMNKWSGRDEVVTARIGKILKTADGKDRRPSRRELCRAFHDIDQLTHWPVGEALGDAGAATLARDADADIVRRWVRARREAPVQRSRHEIALPSALNLWWFPPRTLLLHYHVLPDRTYLFRIARRHIDVRILRIGRLHLGVDMRNAIEDKELLGWLAEYTGIRDAIDCFPGIRRLAIVPHDAMANVPFAALPVGGRPLCTVAPIVQVDRLMRLARRRRRPRPGIFLSAGRMSYRGSTLASLPSAELEAAAVVEAFGTPGTVVRDATRQGVLAALPSAARLHVAAHGVFDADDPARSGIVLGDGAGGYDTLTLSELRRADLRGLQLATLATCRSAVQAQLPGRARICLPTALLDAGARGVIASLWPVEDDPSFELMPALYRKLRTLPPAQALATVQREMSESHPARHWAGFVFYGNE